MNILDIGIGDGGWKEIQDVFPRYRNIRSSWLYEYGSSYAYGIDVDESKIRRAKNRINNGSQFLVMNAKHMSFPDGFFNIVHLNDVLCDDEMMMEIKRTMSDVGIIILKESINNFRSLFSSGIFILFLDLAFGKKLMNSINETESDWYLNKFREVGFKITGEEYYWYFEILGWTNLWFCNYVSKLLKAVRLNRVFCRKIVVTAIKL
jgi:ubiquinone/menaquinone biosynthesis C-methylase UbiE